MVAVWTVQNAEMVTYRDGTPIPQVGDATEWKPHWCHGVIDNDPTRKLYNWYALVGLHDNDPFTSNKGICPLWVAYSRKS